MKTNGELLGLESACVDDRILTGLPRVRSCPYAAVFGLSTIAYPRLAITTHKPILANSSLSGPLHHQTSEPTAA